MTDEEERSSDWLFAEKAKEEKLDEYRRYGRGEWVRFCLDSYGSHIQLAPLYGIFADGMVR